MKKLLPLALTLLLLLAACAREDTPAPTQPTETTTETEEATAPVSGTIPTEEATQAEAHGLELGMQSADETHTRPGSNDPMMRVSLSVLADTGVASADAYYQQWLDDTLYYIGLERADLESILADGVSVTLPYEYEAGFSVPRNDGTVLSVSRYYYTFTGGVHGGAQYFGETFVVESGVLLTLSDMFTVPQSAYLPRLMEAVMAQIEDGGLADTLFESYAQLVPESFDPRNFYLTETGITLFWQQYDIAPYASGPQLFEIPYADLAGILNPQWLPL